MEKIVTRDVPQCIYCGSSGSIRQGEVYDPDGNIPEPWTYRQCSNAACNLVWLDPAPLPSELWKAYTTYHTHAAQRIGGAAKALLSLANRLARWSLLPLWVANGMQRESGQMRFMMLAAAACGRLLDVGCGGGRFLHRMQRRGWEVEGIDFDEQATRRVSEKYGIKTYTGDLAAAHISAASFDVITMSHTIEHLVDPEATLRECLRILRPGGRVVLVTPNPQSNAANRFGGFWRGWEPPRHLHLFPVDALARFAGRAGFEVEEARTSAVGSAIIYRVSAASQRLHEGKPGGFLFKLRLVPWSYYRELCDYREQQAGKHTAQNVVVIARKPSA
jgi:SAM-dependent methyltransferase